MSQSDNQSVSTIKPGRETDARIAEALGKSICPHEECNDAECDASVVAHASDGMLHRGDMPGSPVWSPSTVEADAISALDATRAICILAMQGGKVWICRSGENEHQAIAREPDGIGQPWMLAASAAILAWAEAKGSSK